MSSKSLHLVAKDLNTVGRLDTRDGFKARKPANPGRIQRSSEEPFSATARSTK